MPNSLGEPPQINGKNPQIPYPIKSPNENSLIISQVEEGIRFFPPY